LAALIEDGEMSTVMWDEAWSNPVFSIAERDRRHELVRSLMGRDGVDVLCCLPWTSRHDASQGDSRYLTQLGENSDETTVAFSVDDLTAWHSRGGAWPSSSWLSDLRAAPRGTGGRTIVQWLRERGLEQGTLAIAGLRGGVLNRWEAIEGEVNWHSVQLIREALPDLRIVSGTDLLGEARFVKSAEEIDALRRGREIAGAVLDTAVSTARTGVTERDVWAQMLYTYADLGGSFEPDTRWITGPAGALSAPLPQPTFRRFQSGDLFVADVQGRWAGYGARAERLVGIGGLPPGSVAATDRSVEAFGKVAAAARPGATVRDLLAAAAELETSGQWRVEVTVTGCGVGGDGPMVRSVDLGDPALDVRLVENAVLAVSCQAGPYGQPAQGRWGDTLVVGPEGGVPLVHSDGPSCFDTP
jgi:Xaa-Pro aminopeptidase